MREVTISVHPRTKTTRHDGPVQHHDQRDTKSVTIATGVLLSAAVLGLGLVALWMAVELLHTPHEVVPALMVAIEATAVAVLVGYVARNRRR